MNRIYNYFQKRINLTVSGTTIRVLIFTLLFTSVGNSQSMDFITNDEFIESGNTVTNTKTQGLVSEMVSADLVTSNLTGNIYLRFFKVNGATLTNANFEGSITLGITPSESTLDMYRIRLSKLGSIGPFGTTGGPDTVQVAVFDPQGQNLGSQNITLTSGSRIYIYKSNSGILTFKYGSTTIAQVTGANAPYYRAVMQTTGENISFNYVESNFSVNSDYSYPEPIVTDTNKNWTSVKTFDIDGSLSSASVSYFDCLARPIQSQSKDIITGKNWTAVSLYDSQGREALSTLSAPINNNLNFTYKNGFIKNSSNSNYSLSDFETNPELPSTVANNDGTLGWYYSTNNTSEPFQDITDRPFSRTIYDDLNPGKVRAVVGGNRALNTTAQTGSLQYNFPQGFSHTMPAAQELYYAFGKDYFPENRQGWFDAHGIDEITGISGKMITHRATKTVAIDAHGNESVVFTDLEGKVLAAARSGNVNNMTTSAPKYNVVSIIGPQGYVDVHIPKGITSAEVNRLGGDTNYQVWNLRTGEEVTPSSMSGGNIYRVQYNTLQTVDKTIISINTSGNLVTRSGAKGVSYKVNYSEYTLNYYDDAGQLKESVQPLGFDNSTITGGLNTVPSHAMISGYNYNSLGQLLSTSSPDEGNSSFVYRKDGQIRFSQNEKQEAAGEYSYTNYDEYARPVESGVCSDEYPGSLPTGINDSFAFVADYPDNISFTSNSVQKIANNGSSGTNAIKGSFLSTDTLVGDFRLSWTTTGSTVFFGLSNQDTGTNWTNIDYAIYRYGSHSLRVAQNGSWGTYQAGYSDGDILSIERIGTTITYRWGDVILDQNFNATDEPLHLDGNISTVGTSLVNIQIEFLNNPNDQQIDPSLCSERTFTLYDETDNIALNNALGSLPNKQQRFVAGNVSKTWTEAPATNTSWYSYDIYGRVEWMVQQIVGLGTKVIEYTYDPITGEVLEVFYYGDSESFTHQYTYNDKRQLVTVKTSRDGAPFKEQASYEYYETGALKRVNIAQDVQGVDYVYNLSGALKSINHPSLEASRDPGGDTGDLFGMIIDYHKEDYKRSGIDITTTTAGIDRYDGNIKATRWGTKIDGQTVTQQKSYVYEYDHNNWLKDARFGAANNSGGITNDTYSSYRVSGLTYDPNGNIKTLTRRKNFHNFSGDMDQLTYSYPPNSNRLDHVNDAVTSNQPLDDITDQASGNYTYNAIGQLTRNAQDDNNYVYTTSGLVESVLNSNGSIGVRFEYDDRGHRIKKEAINFNVIIGTTYYVRDASGQPLAIYSGAGATTIEHPIYGSSRLGINKSSGDTYELTDHLGNVRVVVEDDNTTAGNMLGRTDYYPFGMPMPFFDVQGDYRYAYQGQEKDPETGKEAFELRLWDSRIGRWLTTDPYNEFHSPYLGMGNNPIRKIDPNGGKTDDWVLGADGSIYWDDNVNSQADACAGCTWLGTSLTFTFNSFIDAGLWDGPGGDGPAGDKLTSYITLSASENSKGQLTGISAISHSVIGDTPVGTARNFYPGTGGSNNIFSTISTSINGKFDSFGLNFEQHASVSPIEEFGLNVLGYKIVDVAQKLNINVQNGNLSLSAYTNIFPSATLSVQGHKLIHYNQPSFVETHKAPIIYTSPSNPYAINPIPTVQRDFSYYPSQFYKRN